MKLLRAKSTVRGISLHLFYDKVLGPVKQVIETDLEIETVAS